MSVSSVTDVKLDIEQLKEMLTCSKCREVQSPLYSGDCGHFVCGKCIQLPNCVCICRGPIYGFVEISEVNDLIHELLEEQDVICNENENALQIAEVSTSSKNNVNRKNKKGETALHTAAIHGDFEKAQKLLLTGADPNVQDNSLWTPLHEAASYGRRNIIVLLMDNGANVNALGYNDITPLHDAVQTDNSDTVQILVSRGADIYSRDINGKTPFDYAKTDDIKRILKQSCFYTLGYELPRKLVFVSSNLRHTEEAKLLECANILQACVVSQIDANTTHLITTCKDGKNCARTLKYMNAIARGIWIVSYQWILDCIAQNTCVDESAYEVQGVVAQPNTQAPRKSRLHAAANSTNFTDILQTLFSFQLKPIFSGCQFYFHGTFTGPSKEDLHKLVNACKATVLTRAPTLASISEDPSFIPFQGPGDPKLKNVVYYIFYRDTEPPAKRDHALLKTFHLSFFFDCLSNFELKIEDDVTILS